MQLLKHLADLSSRVRWLLPIKLSQNLMSVAKPSSSTIFCNFLELLWNDTVQADATLTRHLFRLYRWHIRDCTDNIPRGAPLQFFDTFRLSDTIKEKGVKKQATSIKAKIKIRKPGASKETEEKLVQIQHEAKPQNWRWNMLYCVAENAQKCTQEDVRRRSKKLIISKRLAQNTLGFRNNISPWLLQIGKKKAG